MKTVGFPISLKENEKRRALVPSNSLKRLLYKELIYVESGYGDILGFCDEDYRRLGINVTNRDVVLSQNIICDPKIGDAEYIISLHDQTVFGWLHAVQNRTIAEALRRGKLTAYAWEEMYEKGRHVFWRNNEIAGEAAIMHAYLLYGKFPYDTKVAVLGRGNVARGAIKILHLLGADVMVYDRGTEKLFRQELSEFDVIVNGVLWDTARKDHILYRKDLESMKKGAMIIDISCDRNGGIESSIPTTFENPIYYENNILHYAVDHTPALFYKTISEYLSEIVCTYINLIMDEKSNSTLQKCLIAKDGLILDNKIIEFQRL